MSSQHITTPEATLAAGDAGQPDAASDTPPRPMPGDAPEARMSRRFPQKIRVGDLIGAEVIDDDRKVLGHVAQVVRTPQGKIQLIVLYSRWFGWFARPVAVPIERVGSLGRQVGSIDMEEREYVAAPTWQPGSDVQIPSAALIWIALAKR